MAFAPFSVKSQDPIRKTKKRTLSSIMLEKKRALANRKSDKKKWKEERKITIVTEKNVKKHHRHLQTKHTLKSMRKLKRKSKSTRN